jgi:hypothetical protein
MAGVRLVIERSNQHAGAVREAVGFRPVLMRRAGGSRLMRVAGARRSFPVFRTSEVVHRQLDPGVSPTSVELLLQAGGVGSARIATVGHKPYGLLMQSLFRTARSRSGFT